MTVTATDSSRIWVDPATKGRLTGWVVRCDACPGEIFLPLRTKLLAVEVANSHSKEVHQGRGIVAVKKPPRR